jgi:Na+/H+-dicarboxylate symporter
MILAALQLSHFTAAFTFSVFASIVFGVTQRNDPRDMLRYGAQCFAWFILGMFVAGWIMWFLHH